MDLEGYGMKELLLAAIKSEVESKEVYLQLSTKVNNAFLADKLRFIAEEEEKHRDYLESVFKMEVQDGDIVLPKESPVPLPEVKVDSPLVQASDIMGQAMEAELAASDFYGSLSKMFKDQEIIDTLNYLSKMEVGHYKLLEIEKDILESQEDFEVEWDMMHVGP
jgi:rubrerythrin